jgi:hypothetical protein
MNILICKYENFISNFLGTINSCFSWCVCLTAQSFRFLSQKGDVCRVEWWDAFFREMHLHALFVSPAKISLHVDVVAHTHTHTHTHSHTHICCTYYPPTILMHLMQATSRTMQEWDERGWELKWKWNKSWFLLYGRFLLTSPCADFFGWKMSQFQFCQNVEVVVI